MDSEASAKEQILQVTIELISSVDDIENITSRQIAGKAGVNLALINYYYQSKENLLTIAVGFLMGSIIDRVLAESAVDADAVTRLKRLLTTTANFSFKHNKLFKVAVAGELKQGCQNSCEMAMPLLKEIFPERDRTELRIIALQLFQPFHNIVLYPEVYSNYLKTDFYDEQERTRMIHLMTDMILSRF